MRTNRGIMGPETVLSAQSVADAWIKEERRSWRTSRERWELKRLEGFGGVAKRPGEGKRVHPLSTVGSGLSCSPASASSCKPPTPRDLMDIPVAGTPRNRVPGATWQPSAAKMLSCSQEDLHLSFHCFSCFVVLTGHTRASIMGTVYGFWRRLTRQVTLCATLYSGELVKNNNNNILFTLI